jgi:hypothetical protein
MIQMKIRPPSQKLVALSHKLSSEPPKRLSAEQVRSQVIQHLAESKAEMMRAGQMRPQG